MPLVAKLKFEPGEYDHAWVKEMLAKHKTHCEAPECEEQAEHTYWNRYIFVFLCEACADWVLTGGPPAVRQVQEAVHESFMNLTFVKANQESGGVMMKDIKIRAEEEKVRARNTAAAERKENRRALKEHEEAGARVGAPDEAIANARARAEKKLKAMQQTSSSGPQELFPANLFI